MKKKILLIDGHGLAFRGFYAVPEGLNAIDGTPANAIVGFMNMFVKALSEWQPDAVALFFDPKGPTVRKKIFDQYKAGRKPAPESFKVQLPVIIDICKTAGIPVFTKDGIEADDYIVATAKNIVSENADALILSADKDLLQIVGNGIYVIRPTKGVTEFDFYDEDFFEKKYGFKPCRMSDYLALLGDAADNIPGVAGIGEKGATELVQKYASLEELYEHLSDFKGAKLKHLEEGKQAAFDSRLLVLPIDVEPVRLCEMERQKPDGTVLKKLCENYRIRKCYSQLMNSENELVLNDYTENNKNNIAKKAMESEILFNKETTQSGLNSNEVGLTDILSSKNVNIAAKGASEGKTDVFCANGSGEYCVTDINTLKASAEWEKWTEEGTLTVHGLRALLLEGVKLPSDDRLNDVEAVHYMLHPDKGGAAVEKTIGALPSEKDYVAQLLNIYMTFYKQLTDKQKMLMKKLDLPLTKTLVRMQLNGIPADISELEKLESELTVCVETIQSEIWNKAGEEFNLNSPKQVGYILFERLMLPALKKTKTGYSTGIEVLEELAALPKPLCEVPKLLIEYREMSKLLSGFVQPYIKLAREGYGRIHSTFDQLETGTGRLASYSPNVQNIPQFGIWAEKFKQTLHPAEANRVFVSADYSQIELRILAHLSGEERLLDAFREGRDVHLETASWVFGLPPEDITKEQRRFAKVVNFGLLYGMSTFGLAQRLAVPRPQAKSIVDRYFSVLPGVRKYIEQNIAEAKSAGYTISIFGRRRPLDEVSTIEGRGNNPIDRVAVNTPIQSAASDIAKMALLEFDKKLSTQFPNAFCVLQVHDSIVCECDACDVEGVKQLLISTMENVCNLSVPLKVEAKSGRSLKDI